MKTWETATKEPTPSRQVLCNRTCAALCELSRPKRCNRGRQVFGSHTLAGALACRHKAFLCLVKCEQLGLQGAGVFLGQGESYVTSNVDASYAPHVYENRKVGGKAPRVLQVVTNSNV